LDAVREGRKREFGFLLAGGDAPDPAAEDAFLRSKIDWDRRDTGRGKLLCGYYRGLIELRKTHPALRSRRKEDLEAGRSGQAFILDRWSGSARLWCAMNFGAEATRLELPPGGAWRKVLDSADVRWEGPGSAAPESAAGGSRVEAAAQSALVYARREDSP
jgi:maltooligosyltrehalose trehalohydrolase